MFAILAGFKLTLLEAVAECILLEICATGGAADDWGGSRYSGSESGSEIGLLMIRLRPGAAREPKY